ncbi:Fe/B12 periplasmic-binding domain-containing protein [Sphingomonas antarctica]
MALAACSRSGSPVTGRIVAAGPPAAILIWTVARDKLAGWPRKPSPKVLAMLGAGADLPEIGAVSQSGGRAANLEAIAALKPELIVDYGDVTPQFREIAERTEAKLGVPYRLVDGQLEASASAFAHVAKLIGAPRGIELANAVRPLLRQWRALPGGPSFYYARGIDGLETGFAGSLATGVLEGAHWTNVATGGESLKRVSREAVAAWDPEVIVTLDRKFAESAASDPFWRQRRGGAKRRLLLLPDLPFGWIDRPPSVNRLVGCAWLVGGDARADATAHALYGAQARLGMAKAQWIP